MTTDTNGNSKMMNLSKVSSSKFYALICLAAFTMFIIMLCHPNVYRLQWRQCAGEQEEIVRLTLKLYHALTELEESHNDVRVLAQHLAYLVKESRQKFSGSSKVNVRWPWSSLATRQLVRCLKGEEESTYQSTYEPVSMPTIYSFMPHLLHETNALIPALHIANTIRKRVSMVIGLPVVRSTKTGTLVNTINNLLYNMAPDEEEKCVIVVSIGEVINFEYVMEVADELQSKFQILIEMGVIEIISIPASYYPNNLNTFVGSLTETQILLKKNLDYAFIMAYARSRGAFYLQLEDDVATQYGFISSILKESKHHNPLSQKQWFMLDYSRLNLQALLFRTSDLPRVIQSILMFQEDKPMEWILDALVTSIACTPMMNSTICDMVKDQIWIRHNSTLFYHGPSLL